MSGCYGLLAGKKAVRRLSDLYEAFRQPFQAAISCFSRATFNSRSPYVSDLAFPMRLSQEPTPLGRVPVLFLQFSHTYRIAQRKNEWEIQTVAYSYWLEDRLRNELLLYQWDPTEGSKVTTPHLHVRPLTMLTNARLTDEQLPTASREVLGRFGKAHLPTGFVTLAEILQMAIVDLGVTPLERDPKKVAERLATADEALRASLRWRSAW